ncbi:MAG: hypothetical protein JW973_08360 [Bacteroidales bacterium]|nr:hypothetical protein [Bacteroidales bacterium]
MFVNLLFIAGFISEDPSKTLNP